MVNKKRQLREADIRQLNDVISCPQRQQVSTIILHPEVYQGCSEHLSYHRNVEVPESCFSGAVPGIGDTLQHWKITLEHTSGNAPIDTEV